MTRVRGFDHIHTPITALTKSGAPFKNQFLSVSRVQKFADCPLSFYYRYIEKVKEQRSVPALFGNVCHWALEDLYKWILLEEYKGVIPKEKLSALFAEWYEESRINVLPDVDGMGLFEDGRDILQRFAVNNPTVDHRNIIQAEKKFVMPLGDGLWDVLGYMDRVDRTNPAGEYRDDEVTVRDYKTGRMLFNGEELKSSLQASIYTAAIKREYPWAKKVHFAFDMLRHGITQWTSRDTSQLRIARDYMLMIARQSEDAEAGYPARLNKFCGWCSYSNRCTTYQRALREGGEDLKSVAVPEAIEEIAKEREHAAQLHKIAAGRKGEMEKLLKAQFEKEGPVKINGMVYKWIKTRNGISYDREKTIEFLVQQGVGDDAELRKKLLIVDPARLTKLITDKGKKGMRPSEAKMLKIEVEAMAKQKYSTRLDARADKER